MKPGDLVKLLVDDDIVDLSSSFHSPKIGIVVCVRAQTADVLIAGKIDRMVPTGWLEVIDAESR